MIFDVGPAQGLEILAGDRGHCLRAPFGGVGADVVVVPETRRRDQRQHRRVRAFDGDCVVTHADFAAADLGAQPGFESQTAVLDLTEQRELVTAAHGGPRQAMRAGQTRREIHAARLVRRDSPDDRRVRVTGERLALEGGIAVPVAYPGDGRVQVQLAAIISHVRLFGEGQ